MLYHVLCAILFLLILRVLQAGFAISTNKGKAIKLVVSSLWSTPRLFLNLICQLPFKSSAVPAKNFPPSLDMVMANYKFDQKIIKSYRKACGFASDEAASIPILCLSMPVVTMTAMSLAAPAFPLAALGCIHTRQKIVVLRRVLPSEKLNYQCSFGSINDTEKGTEVTINQTVTLSSDPSVIVFNGEMTFLSQGGAKKKKEEKKTTRDAEEVSASHTSLIILFLN
jgi:hypothetical protein